MYASAVILITVCICMCNDTHMVNLKNSVTFVLSVTHLSNGLVCIFNLVSITVYFPLQADINSLVRNRSLLIACYVKHVYVKTLGGKCNTEMFKTAKWTHKASFGHQAKPIHLHLAFDDRQFVHLTWHFLEASSEQLRIEP